VGNEHRGFIIKNKQKNKQKNKKKRGDTMLYDTKKFVENLEYYAHDIFNYNARARESQGKTTITATKFT
jgi:hypothetical protein